MRKTLAATVLPLLLGACIGPLVPVIRLDMTTADALRMDVLVYEGVTPGGAARLGPLTATSCQNKLWNPSPTNANAIAQISYQAKQMGGNALGDVLCERPEGTNLAKNCWASITCHAVALRTP